jgi:hypothetical protein
MPRILVLVAACAVGLVPAVQAQVFEAVSVRVAPADTMIRGLVGVQPGRLARGARHRRPGVDRFDALLDYRNDGRRVGTGACAADAAGDARRSIRSESPYRETLASRLCADIGQAGWQARAAVETLWRGLRPADADGLGWHRPAAASAPASTPRRQPAAAALRARSPLPVSHRGVSWRDVGASVFDRRARVSPVTSARPPRYRSNGSRGGVRYRPHVPARPERRGSRDDDRGTVALHGAPGSTGVEAGVDARGRGGAGGRQRRAAHRELTPNRSGLRVPGCASKAPFFQRWGLSIPLIHTIYSRSGWPCEPRLPGGRQRGQHP